MSLHARIAGTEEPKIAFHQFQADVLEWELGERTRAEVIADHNITAAEESELDQLKTLYLRSLDKGVFKASLDNAGLLLEAGMAYTTGGAFNQRLLRAADDWAKVQVYTVATLPVANADSEGHQIYVSDGAGGEPVIAFSDGTQWLRTDLRIPVAVTGR